jgi:hypothetical protein
VTAVRPPLLPPTATAQPARTDPARLAAQRAFFDAALGKAQTAPSAAATVAKVASAAPAATAAGTTRLPDPSAEKPQKILRPGSLLDIRI